ncbi:MAG: zinc dependent phospholipase C family protein, partial [Gemmatimonadaceae bacterium]
MISKTVRRRRRQRAALRLFAMLFLIPCIVAATHARREIHGADGGGTMLWKINTHLFAANVALADAINDGKVTIPPFGEFALRPEVVQALRAAPAAYRAGVLAPDLFPDMYVGGWLIHSDLSEEKDGWTADNWLRHVWTRARGAPNDSDRNKVLAFGYGFLTHGAGDIFAHTWVNQKANGAWVSFTGKDRETAIKHIVLEGFVGEHTPSTDLSLDVWPRFVSNTLIKDAVARRHSPVAKHYQRWLAIADGLPKAIDRARNEMNKNINNDAPYWMKCGLHPVWCARKEHAETWLLDINRGFRALVDSS